ncbi:hypothetical protein [Seonamhaeicola aphaedonensis]|uniref:Uncharacterized protein n=1 Tax=Seonamhaeicola aphaedonensis TaxID=1461338 RepID=A0A3D9H6Y1_9FLAO|nr:hypothetical protein [Seonamhaeicola aphaedonensis]RED44706.1 hypothetical protein DFQ02_1108 [Seonamhaeicola aphaedonensis]
MENPKLLQLDFGFDIDPVQNQKNIKTNTKKAKSDFVFEFMDALTSPIIIYNTAWQDAIPKDLLERITISRMLCLMKGEKMASITETVAYMMPRTFEAPMSSEWCNIYTWCGLQYATQFNSENKKKAMIEAMEGIAPKTLSDYEQVLLKRLRLWIYEKRRKALKASMKNDKPKKLETPETEQKCLFH